VRGGVYQVLAVVHHQEQILLRPQVVGERVRERAARLLAHAQGLGHGLRDEIRVRKRRELHQPRPLRIGRR
jgi:hypothetical protein